ncbi:MAG TPA: diacylglycerol kinase family protein [Chryseolinea sp.]|nr:diacylglycerol kinase family protein [Chryseolinea sp.]
MTFIKVFHNPTAGEAEHSKEKLVRKIKAAGFDCSYSSTKRPINEKRIPAKTDIIAIAGGDGTIRRLAEYFCTENILTKRPPIGLLPWGTANNIATTLGVTGTPEEIMERWKVGEAQNFDIGKIHGLKENHFFLEGFGFGVFPRLIKKMRDRKSKTNDSETELHIALKILHEIIENYKPKECHIVIDDVEYTGKFLLVEVMNIRSIGPNLNISPTGHSGDGEFEVILISETERDALAQYVLDRLEHGKETPFFYTAIKAKKLKVSWAGKLIHVDDSLITLDKFQPLEVEILRDVLHFLV